MTTKVLLWVGSCILCMVAGLFIGFKIWKTEPNTIEKYVDRPVIVKEYVDAYNEAVEDIPLVKKIFVKDDKPQIVYRTLVDTVTMERIKQNHCITVIERIGNKLYLVSYDPDGNVLERREYDDINYDFKIVSDTGDIIVRSQRFNPFLEISGGIMSNEKTKLSNLTKNLSPQIEVVGGVEYKGKYGLGVKVQYFDDDLWYGLTGRIRFGN